MTETKHVTCLLQNMLSYSVREFHAKDRFIRERCVCLFFVPREKFSLIQRYHHKPVKGRKFLLQYPQCCASISSLACHTYMSSPRSEYVHTICCTFDSDNIITCFNDIRLLRSKFEHLAFRTQDKRLNQLHHRRGYT